MSRTPLSVITPYLTRDLRFLIDFVLESRVSLPLLYDVTKTRESQRPTVLSEMKGITVKDWFLGLLHRSYNRSLKFSVGGDFQ